MENTVISNFKDAIVSPEIGGSIETYRDALTGVLPGVDKNKLPLISDFRDAVKQELPAAVERYKKLVLPVNDGVLKTVRQPGLSLSKFFHREFGIAPSDAPTEVGRLSNFFGVLQMDGDRNTVQDFYDLGTLETGNSNTNLRFLIEQVFLAAIQQGISRPAYWQNMIQGTDTTAQTTAEIPILATPFAVMSQANYADTLKEVNFAFSQRTVKPKRYGVKIRMQDELMRVAYNFMLNALTEVGESTNASTNMLALNCLIAGDGNANTAAKVVGVATPGTAANQGIQYDDLLLIYMNASVYGLSYDLVVGNTKAAAKFTKLREVEGFSGDTKKLRVNFQNMPILSELNMLVHPGVPDGKLLLVDTRRAMRKLNLERGASVEADRKVEQQTNELYIRDSFSFYRIIQESAVVVDPTLQFADAQLDWGADAQLTQAFGTF